MWMKDQQPNDSNLGNGPHGNKLKRYIRIQKRKLRNSKASKLGLIETIKLRFYGKMDGKQSLPRETSKSIWTSPQISKEEDGYKEFCAKTWAIVEIETAETHKEVAAQADEVARLDKQIDELRDGLPPPPSEADLSKRREGEGQLDEHLIRFRRIREHEKKISPLLQRINQMDADITISYRRLSKLQALINEVENIGRLSCKKVLDHTNLRIDAYWQGALRTHNQFDKMPPSPTSLQESNTVEAIYFSPHKSLSEHVVKMIDRKKQYLQNTKPM